MKKLLLYFILCFTMVNCGPSEKELTEMAVKNNEGFIMNYFTEIGEDMLTYSEVSVTNLKEVLEGDDEWDKNMMIVDSIRGLENHYELVQSGELFTPMGTLLIGPGWVPGGYNNIVKPYEVNGDIVDVEDLELVLYRATINMTSTINGSDGRETERGIKEGDMWKFDILTAFTTKENPAGYDIRDPGLAFSVKDLSELYYKPVGSTKWFKNPYIYFIPSPYPVAKRGDVESVGIYGSLDEVYCAESFCLDNIFYKEGFNIMRMGQFGEASIGYFINRKLTPQGMAFSPDEFLAAYQKGIAEDLWNEIPEFLLKKIMNVEVLDTDNDGVLDKYLYQKERRLAKELLFAELPKDHQMRKELVEKGYIED